MVAASWSLPTFVAVLVGALVVLSFAIAALLRVARGTELARLGFVPVQEFRLDAAGPVVLYGEGPRFTRRFRGLGFRVADRATGERVPERRLWMHVHADAWSRVRLGLARFDVVRPGVYRLEVAGLVPAAEDDTHAFVLMPPVGLGLPLAILTTIVAAASAIGSIVGIGLIVLGTDLDRSTPSPGTSDQVATVRSAGMGERAGGAGRGGRQLRADAGGLPALRDVRWDAVGLVLGIPAAWQVRAQGDELDVRDPARPSTYVAGHVVSFPAPTSSATLAGIALGSAADKLAAGLLEGYAVVRFADVDGVVTIESRGDGASRMAVWTAYRQTPAGVRNLTVVVGAEGAEFDRLEGTIVAILASARFG